MRSESDYIRELEFKVEMLTAFANGLEVGLCVMDYHTGKVIYANRKWMSIFAPSRTLEELEAKECWALFGAHGKRCDHCPNLKLIDSEGNLLPSHSWERYYKGPDVWLKVISQAIKWMDGNIAHVVSFFDITSSKRMQARIDEFVFTDRSLQLKNSARLELDVMEAAPSPSLIVLDIVSLQKVNDAYGRETGDALLAALRDWIYWMVGSDNTDARLYRIGGDEFCLSLAQISPEALAELAVRLQRRFGQPWVLIHETGETEVFCDVTVGVIHAGFVRSGQMGSQGLLNIIHRTFEAARKSGKVTYYNKKMDDQFKQQLELELSLKHCVHNQMVGFEVHYQAIADPRTGRWCGLEALCRWHSPELGPISPVTFIPEVERLEMIGTLGLWVLEESIRFCKECTLDELDHFILDVNVSAIQFFDESLASKVAKVLSRHNYPGSKLCLEITESTQFTFTDKSLATIERLKDQGILVALDDFGTGYSSFNNLKLLPVDIVKVEREFVVSIETDEYHQHLLGTMIDLAHAAGKVLIAEGVETQSQAELIRRKGADYLQGYHYSKPLPGREVRLKLTNFHSMASP